MKVIVIGAGAGGLVVAIGAARAGKKVILVEKGHFGGDCTNFGCIPSKSLIASGHVAHALKRNLGVDFNADAFNADGALERVRSIVNQVRSHEEPEALEKLGIKTIKGCATFIDPRHISVNGETIEGDRFVIATGSRPQIPNLNGLSETPYLTNETVFDLKKVPKSLMCLGGGPIGCELAQALNRLGAKVTLLQHSKHLLKRETAAAQALIEKTFIDEGIDLQLGIEMESVSYDGTAFHLNGLQAEALLVSTGRKPNIEELNLEKAQVHFSQDGIAINRACQTSQKHIFAVGDVTGPPFFTHRAEFHGRTALKNILLPIKSKWPKQEIPRVTFTDPEVASIGLNKEEALEQYSEKKLHIYELPFTEIDRALCVGHEEGFIQIVTKKWSSQILGATIVGERAGEMLAPISLAMQQKIPLRKFAAVIPPYPTYSIGLRKLGDRYLLDVILASLKKS